MTYAAYDLNILTRTLWGEARSEGLAGMIAVAHVVLNRARRGGWWGATVAEVCLWPQQFSAWNEGDPNRAKIMMLGKDDDLTLPMAAATAALSGIHPDPTGGATHYHTAAVAPKWASGKTPSAVIGRHRFYRNIA